MSKANKGKKLSKEDCDKRSQMMKAWYATEKGIQYKNSRIGKKGTPSPMKGKKLSQERIAAITGQKRSEETKQKMREAAKKAWASKTKEELILISQSQQRAWEKRKAKK